MESTPDDSPSQEKSDPVLKRITGFFDETSSLFKLVLKVRYLELRFMFALLATLVVVQQITLIVLIINYPTGG